MIDFAALATKYKDAAIVVTWALTTLGWYYNSKAANERELRKEVRKEVDDCIRAAYDLLSQVKAYYYDPGREHDAERTSKIRFDQHRLFTRLERLTKRCPLMATYEQRGALMDQFTGDDFDSVTRAVLAPRDQRIREMEGVAHALIDRLEETFIEQFPD